MHLYGVPVVVAINSFVTDTRAELELVQKLSRDAGAADAVICSHWAHGGISQILLLHSVICLIFLFTIMRVALGSMTFLTEINRTPIPYLDFLLCEEVIVVG